MMLLPQIQAATPLLRRLDCAVLCSTGPAFITSDNPCVWFDPLAYQRAPLYQTAALIYKTMVLTGLRRGELASLTVAQLRLDGPMPHIELDAAVCWNFGVASVPSVVCAKYVHHGDCSASVGV